MGLEWLVDTTFLGKAAWLWLTFVGVVAALLAFDLGVLHREKRVIGAVESLWLSGGYVTVALLFGVWVWFELGSANGLDYFTVFLVEKSLSLDNVFVISLIFTYFAVPAHLQHKVLFWGILGVVVLRALMIGAGTALVTQFEWVLYLFGAFLLVTGVKMLTVREHAPDIARNPLLRFLRGRLAVTDGFHGSKFLVRLPDAQGRPVAHATPLFLALITIEFADIVFAVDSVPAALAITTDPYVVYTANIFAILGLRALYFAVGALVRRFAYLNYALALILIFIGGKLFWNQLVGKVDPLVSLGVTASLLAGGVIVSLLCTRDDAQPALRRG